MMRARFELAPVRTRSLVWRLRPLGHLTMQPEPVVAFINSMTTSGRDHVAEAKMNWRGAWGARVRLVSNFPQPPSTTSTSSSSFSSRLCSIFTTNSNGVPAKDTHPTPVSFRDENSTFLVRLRHQPPRRCVQSVHRRQSSGVPGQAVNRRVYPSVGYPAAPGERGRHTQGRSREQAGCCHSRLCSTTTQIGETFEVAALGEWSHVLL